MNLLKMMIDHENKLIHLWWDSDFRKVAYSENLAIACHERLNSPLPRIVGNMVIYDSIHTKFKV